MKFYIIIQNSKFKIQRLFCILLTTFSFLSCENYLSPNLDKQLTLEETFSKKNSVERYLAHVYSFLPKDYHAVGTWGWDWSRVTSAVSRSDESYFSWVSGMPYLAYNSGAWNPTTSDFHTWKWYYQGINQATVFINNVGYCKELTLNELETYTAEIRFLRAFYYMLLIQQYGPVFVWKDNELDLTIKGPEVDRHSLDVNIDYIVSELEAAEAALRKNNVFQASENKWQGRVTLGAVLAAKSRFLLYMARPLFNGHQWYIGLKNYYDEYLFPQKPDPTKWDKAAETAYELIQIAQERQLFELYVNTTEANSFTRAIRSYQGIYFDKWNKELIWAFWQGSGFDWAVRANPSQVLREGFAGYSPSLKLVDTYPMAQSGRFPITGYRSDGYPDIDGNSGYREEGFTDGWTHPADGYPMNANFPVHNSCVGRDARFYASIFFSGMHWINDYIDYREQFPLSYQYITFHSTGTSAYGVTQTTDFVKNGYLFRRMNNPANNTNAGSWGNFSWPFFRLAEVYLNYAECCNEKTQRNETEGLIYWNRVRERAGLNKIQDAYPEIIGNKELFRVLLKKERMVEFAFENLRYYDVNTWAEGTIERNGPRFGRDLRADDYRDSWRRTDAICTPIVCLPKHHLFPIPQAQLNEMINITQNYGW